MSNWLLFQLVFDIVVCVLVIVFVLRDAKARKDNLDTKGLELLVEEFKKAVERSENSAQHLNSRLKDLAQKKGPVTQADGVGQRIAGKGNGKPAKGSPSYDAIEDHKRKVRLLYKQGVAKVDISKMLSIPLPEVELIIAMTQSDD